MTHDLKRHLSAVVFIAAILIMVGIPASATVFHLRSQDRWAWSMFSGYQISYQYYLEIDEELVPTNPTDVGWFWGHIRYGDHLPKRLCNRHPEASAVHRERHSGGNYRTPPSVNHSVYQCDS